MRKEVVPSVISLGTFSAVTLILAMGDNFGSDYVAWELSVQAKNAFTSSFVNDADPHDDLFDSGIYRASASAFNRQGHALHPRTQTAYRVVDFGSQGLPASADSLHGRFVYGAVRGADGRIYHAVPAQQFRARDPNFA